MSTKKTPAKASDETTVTDSAPQVVVTDGWQSGMYVPQHIPTKEEAREMFKANPGLWAVLTDEGNVTRDQC